jgi:hypothetical protein
MYKIIFSWLIFFSALITPQAIGPRVTIPQINFDYSGVPNNSTFTHTYMIYNGGGGVLKLSNVSSSCKCITAHLDKTTLTPTDSARLEVSYFNAPNPKGIDNYITIKTNDADNPDVRIFISRAIPTGAPTLASMPHDSIGGNEVKPIIFFPETEHNFGKIKQGAIVSYTFKFSNKGSTVLTIKDITTSCGCTAAVVKDKDIAPGKDGEIEVQFDSTGKIGKLSRRITIMSNDPKDGYHNLIIYADVEKD